MNNESKRLQIEKATIADDEHNEIIKTMTPKEKAEQLIDKFYQTTPNEAWINEPIGIAKEYKAFNQAKECALIAVDEIIEMSDINKIFYSFYEGNCLTEYTEDFYWKKVKQEIEKI
jgi:hypothetical protein